MQNWKKIQLPVKISLTIAMACFLISTAVTGTSMKRCRLDRIHYHGLDRAAQDMVSFAAEHREKRRAH
ncbi:hypothetical protein [Hoeflea sp.]|uniref:hypothetical protein n=1 Tax=Hoeflea sp. TaxID=1940281 RepID=UPI003B01B39C